MSASIVILTADSSKQILPENLNAFAKLKARLEALEAVPSIDEIDALLREWAATGPHNLDDYRAFKPATYARHRVMRNEYAELLVLCWRPGQRTPIHDHNGSSGAVLVHEGVLWETMFEINEANELNYHSAREWRPGQVTDADVLDIHQLGNPEVSGQNLVTVHIYAPPLGVLNTYRVGSAEVGRYSPDEYMHGAGI